MYDNALGYWKDGESFIIDELNARLRILYKKYLEETVSVLVHDFTVEGEEKEE